MKIRSRLLTVAAGWLAATLFRTLARTMRFEYVCDEPGLDPSESTSHPYIYALWHDQILPPLARHSLSQPKVAALVSKHQDGSYLTEFMQRSGIRAVRGSTSRGGDQALRELLHVPDDYNIFITPDGPRGPHHQLKSGVVFLASRSGRAIIPVATAVPRSWYWNGSWTGQLIPKPFSTCYFRIGKPFSVPAGATREELAEYQAQLQRQLEQLESEIDELLASKGEPAVVRFEPRAAAPRRKAA